MFQIAPQIKPQRESQRMPNRHYYLQDPSTLMETVVCQSFFLKTLGYTSSRIMQTFYNKMTEGESGMLRQDQRGKATPANKKDRGIIMEHILQTLEHRLQTGDIYPTVRYMYNNFNEHNPSYCTYEVYRRIFVSQQRGEFLSQM